MIRIPPDLAQGLSGDDGTYEVTLAGIVGLFFFTLGIRLVRRFRSAARLKLEAAQHRPS
jgi:hypothetical protein